DQRLMIVAGEEESTGGGIPEVGNRGVHQPLRRLEVTPVLHRLEDIEQCGDEERVIVEMRMQLGAAVLPCAEQAITALQLTLDKRDGVDRDLAIAGIVEQLRRLGEGADHQAVPRGENLAVEARLDAPLARREQRGARLLELRAHGGDVAAEELGELLDLERDVQDVAMLEVAGAGDVPVAGRQLSDFFTKELHELAFVPE